MGSERRRSGGRGFCLGGGGGDPGRILLSALSEQHPRPHRPHAICEAAGFHAQGIEPTQQQIAPTDTPLPQAAVPPRPGDPRAPIEQLGGTMRDPLFDPIEEDARTRITQNVPDPKFHLDWALRLFSTAAIQRDNEQTYRLIFGSQIKALKAIAHHAGFGPKTLIVEGYNDARKAFPDAYEDFDFDKWFGFLLSRQLVAQPNEETVALTARGYAFLSFMAVTGVPEDKLL